MTFFDFSCNKKPRQYVQSEPFFNTVHFISHIFFTSFAIE